MCKVLLFSLLFVLPGLAGAERLSLSQALSDPAGFERSLGELTADLVAKAREDGVSPETRHNIFSVLGLIGHGSVPAVELLLDHIDSTSPRPSVVERGGIVLGHYPAREALARIGKFAADRALLRLKLQPNSKNRSALIEIIKHAYREGTDELIVEALIKRDRLEGKDSAWEPVLALLREHPK